ncbi:hypothetical protein [Pseudomonas triticicola]
MNLSDLTGAQDHFLCISGLVIAIGINKQKRPGIFADTPAVSM